MIRIVILFVICLAIGLKVYQTTGDPISKEGSKSRSMKYVIEKYNKEKKEKFVLYGIKYNKEKNSFTHYFKDENGKKFVVIDSRKNGLSDNYRNAK